MRSTTIDKFLDGVGNEVRVNLMLDIPLDSGAVKLPTRSVLELGLKDKQPK